MSLWIGLSRATAALNEADETNQDQFEMIDQLLLKISQETLLNQPGTQEVRADIQSQALGNYEKLLSKLERNQRLPLQIAKVRTLMGRLKGDLDAPEQALALFESAEYALSKIKETDPENQAMLKILSEAQTERGGLLYRKHASEEATDPLLSALENRRRLVELDPGNVEWGALLANAEMNLGLLEEMKGHRPQALEQYLAADRRRKELLAQDPSNVSLLRGQGKSLRNLGGFYGRQHNLTEAEKSLEQSRAAFQKLCDLPKPDPEDLKDLATTWALLGNIAMVRDTEKDLAIAADRYAAAVKVTDELLSRNTAVHSYWELLVQSQMNLALVRERQKKGGEAFAFLKAAFDVAREERAINTTFSTIYAKTLYEMLRMRKWKKLTTEEDAQLDSAILSATDDYGLPWMKKLESDVERAAEYPPAKTLEEFDHLESSPGSSGGKEKSAGK